MSKLFREKFIFSVLLAMVLITWLFCPLWANPSSETEPNDRREQANELKLGESIKGLIQKKGDRDWYKLVVDEEGRNITRVDLTGVKDVNLFIEVYDLNGKKIQTFNVGRKGEPEAIINIGIEKGEYYILVGAREINATDEYTLSTSLVGPWQEGLEFEPNNKKESANELKIGKKVQGYFYPAYDKDWYKINVITPGKNIHKINLSAVSKLQTWIEIYDSTGRKRLIRHNAGREGEPETIINLGVTQGEYFVVVECPSRAFDANVQYTLTVESLGPWQEGTEFEPNNPKEYANALKLNEVIKGYVYPDRDSDWYSFTIPEPGMDILVIEQSGVPKVNTKLYLYDSNGKELKRADSGYKDVGDAIVRMKVASGKYYACVYGYGANAEKKYTLIVGKPKVQPATNDEVQKALTKALNYLAANQTKEGCWPGRYGKSSGIVGMVLMAYVGAECVPEMYSANIKNAIKYLKSQYHPSSSYQAGSKDLAYFGGFIGKNDPMYSHSIATLGLIEALVELNDFGLEPMIQDALTLILRSQNTEHKPEILKGPVKPDSPHYGGWRYKSDNVDSDISVSGWQILALKAAVNAGFSIPDWSLKNAADFIRACYDKKRHGFSYKAGGGNPGCSETGIGVLSLQLCGYPNDPLIPPAIRFMHDNPPVWEFESPGEGWPFYYWYYGTRALMNAGGDDWRIWKAWMCRLLVDHQRSDGSWDVAQKEKRVAKIYSTALGALMLELCCGHTPIYMRRMGNLSVVLEEGAAIAAVPKIIELILDASNSMWGRMENKAKIDIAKEVLSSIIQGLPEDVEVGLRIYGHQHSYKKQICTDSQLVVPVGQIDKKLLIQKVNAITPRGMTPIAYSLQQVDKDLKDIKGDKVIILVSDGKESCSGDPETVAKKLIEAGLQVKIHVVGFDIADETTRNQLKNIAEITDGKYFDASGAKELKSALTEAVRLTYVVYDKKNKEVLHDFVGGDSRRLKVGTYKIILSTEPPTIVDNVVIDQHKETTLIVKKEDKGLNVEVKRK